MKLIQVKAESKFRMVYYKPNPTLDNKEPVLIHIQSGRIIGLPIKNHPVCVYTPTGGARALEEILQPEGGFVLGSYLYGFPAENICDDLFRLTEASIVRVKQLVCTCCGEYFRGRQWHNQDDGYTLGPCCVEYCSSRMSLEDFIITYGIDGFNFNVFEPDRS